MSPLHHNSKSTNQTAGSVHITGSSHTTDSAQATDTILPQKKKQSHLSGFMKTLLSTILTVIIASTILIYAQNITSVIPQTIGDADGWSIDKGWYQDVNDKIVSLMSRLGSINPTGTSIVASTVTLTSVVTASSACTVDGTLARDIGGSIMHCYGGVWKKLAGGTGAGPSVQDFLDTYNGRTINITGGEPFLTDGTPTCGGSFTIYSTGITSNITMGALLLGVVHNVPVTVSPYSLNAQGGYSTKASAMRTYSTCFSGFGNSYAGYSIEITTEQLDAGATSAACVQISGGTCNTGY